MSKITEKRGRGRLPGADSPKTLIAKAKREVLCFAVQSLRFGLHKLERFIHAVVVAPERGPPVFKITPNLKFEKQWTELSKIASIGYGWNMSLFYCSNQNPVKSIENQYSIISSCQKPRWKHVKFRFPDWFEQSLW